MSGLVWTKERDMATVTAIQPTVKMTRQITEREVEADVDVDNLCRPLSRGSLSDSSALSMYFM